MSGPPAAPKEARPRQVALWVFVGLIALSVIGSVVGVAVIRASAEKPVDAARGYLQALADGDAAKALSYTSSAPVDQTLLTNDVLADSRQRAPLSDIQVALTPGYDESVDVHYRLGDQPVDDHYTLSRVSGAWKLDKVSVPVNFMPIIGARLPVVVNGTTVDQQATSAFPVSYAVTTGLKNVDWGENGTTTVSLANPVTDLKLEPRVTDVGKQAFVTGARKIVNACLAKHELAPESCPFGFTQPPSGPKVTESSVRWTLKGNPWAQLGDPEINAFLDPGTAKADTEMSFVVTCRFSNGEGCRPQTDTEKVTFAADLATDPMKVVFTTF